MDTRLLSYLKAMQIEVWHERPSKALAAPDWQGLRQTVAHCTACGLDKTRTQTVFGVGNTEAPLMLIGEAPGFYEDKKGEPFVGRAGQLLDAMLNAIGYNRQTIYIANVLKCRPPNNRDPNPSEISLCSPYLLQQISWIKPKLLLALGRIAAQCLLANQAPLHQLRSKLHTHAASGTPLLVTYHPAYLLRNPRDKVKAWQDLQLVVHTLETLSS